MKNRDNIYLVVRINEGGEVSVCSAHSTFEGADEVVSANNQKWADKGLHDYAHFDVWITTYYDD